jgi:hypothetical protein
MRSFDVLCISNAKVKTLCSSEMSGSFRNTQEYDLKDHNLQNLYSNFGDDGTDRGDSILRVHFMLFMYRTERQTNL